MWMYIEYEPVAAFGLRPSNTTSNGGKSLICPTPYAIKMALLDRIIRLRGLGTAQAIFPSLRDLPIFVEAPLAVSVNRTFQKVLRGYDAKVRQWTSTITQREFVFYAGQFRLAIPIDGDDIANLLLEGFVAINYFGRRGSFFQMTNFILSDENPASLPTFVNASQQSIGNTLGFLQRMDDMETGASFDDVSVFNPKANGARRSYTVAFPYMLDHHGVNHTIYRRISS